MVAEIALAAFAAAMTLYAAQDLYGRAYERHTEHLRSRSGAFHEAARALLDRPDLTGLQLAKLDEIRRGVSSPRAGRIFAGVLKDMRRKSLRGERRDEGSSPGLDHSRPPSSPMVSLLDAADAAMLLVAERDPIWGPVIRRRLHALTTGAKQDRSRLADLMASAVDGGTMHPA